MTPTNAALSDLLPTIRSLARRDKLRLIEMLARELAAEEEAARLLEADTAYEVWSPIDAHGAAEILLHELGQQMAKP